jgi:hypothetical protein
MIVCSLGPFLSHSLCAFVCSLPLVLSFSHSLPPHTLSMSAVCVCVCVCARARARARVCVCVSSGSLSAPHSLSISPSPPSHLSFYLCPSLALSCLTVSLGIRVFHCVCLCLCVCRWNEALGIETHAHRSKRIQEGSHFFSNKLDTAASACSAGLGGGLDEW